MNHVAAAALSPTIIDGFAEVAPGQAVRQAKAVLAGLDAHLLRDPTLSMTAGAALDLYRMRQEVTGITGLRPPGLPQFVEALSHLPSDAIIDRTHVSTKRGTVVLARTSDGTPIGLIVLPPPRADNAAFRLAMGEKVAPHELTQPPPTGA